MEALLPPPTLPPVELRHCERADIWLRVTSGPEVPVPAVPRPKNPERRRRCEHNLLSFCQAYHPDRFRAPSRFHVEFALDLQTMILNRAPGVRKMSRAAPRGIGKSTLAWMAIEWGVIYGHIKVSAIVCGNKGDSEDRLATIRNQLFVNELLAEDFPEIVEWVRSFDGEANRAPAGYAWSGEEIKLPNGNWVIAKSLEGRVRGAQKDSVRPDFVLIDDPESVDSTRSSTETERLEQRICSEVVYLHEQGGCGRYVLLTTIWARDSISDRYTNPKREPEWRGKRYRALIKFPEREDLWDKFGELFFRDPTEKDALATLEETRAALSGVAFDDETPQFQNALRYYAAHKAAMDEGAELLDETRVPLFECYHTIFGSELGRDAFYCELQNDPPEDENKKDTQLAYDFLVKRRQAGLPAGQVPPWARYVRCQVDMGMYKLHWDAVAFGESRTQAVFDCGIEDTDVNKSGALELTDEKGARREMVDAGIRRALARLRERFAQGWLSAHGEVFTPVQIGVDIGGQGEERAWMRTVLEFCNESGPQWIPLKGQPWEDALAKRAGGRNFLWDRAFFLINADEYKLRLVRSFQVPPFDETGKPFPGARVFAAEISNEYLKQQTSEKYQTEFRPGAGSHKAMRVGWHRYGKNHFFDTGHMSQALEDIYPGGAAPWQNRAASLGYIPGEDDE